MIGLRAFTAVFERDDDGYWLVELEQEPRAHSNGRTLAKAREHIVDATALWFEVGPDDLSLVDDVRLPATGESHARRGRRLPLK
jgi:predicted RNase H-like HicB family nuclease